ncbi:TIGR03118 family protein [Lapillicoccus sp.]|uniref:TIGR03118 family protein n=1 Tax=Lapillicoccus sp. TaxID=1909287 RepID=UPI0032649157
MSTVRRWVAVIASGVMAAVLASAASPSAAAAESAQGAGYSQENLVSDQPGHAAIVDPNLVNAWGISRGPNTPIWVSDNGADVTTLYRGAIGGTPVSAVPLVVKIPGGAPTGQVFNDTTDFVVPGTGKPALFIFAGEDGNLSAWNQQVSPSDQAVAVGHTQGAVYKGLTLAHSPFGPLLLAANFHDNRIDVFTSTFQRLPFDFLFGDPSIPKGYAPFNVAEIGHRVFVTYAKQNPARHDDVAGPGHGFINTFTTFGLRLDRFASRGPLDSPWGLTVAPSSFGQFSGDLLVGNFGNGRIHAYDPQTGRLLGTLRGTDHRPISIDGLWGLQVGDAAAGGPNTVWFAAGPDGETHGLLGTLTVN